MQSSVPVSHSQSPGFSLILVLVALCVLIELVLQAGDFGLTPWPRLRSAAYEYGAFWPGLLSDWRPNYGAQPALMFVTYSFLHGGLAHLVMNMVTLVSLGRWVSDRAGAAGFLLVFFGASALGAACFALLALPSTPMVGASGGLFGLAGGIVYWVAKDTPHQRQGLLTAARITVFLILLNVVLYFAFQGRVAWQAHLGGALAGLVLAWALDRRGNSGAGS